ncbi:hypothetical protein FSP39_008826 [Pinctada imbricata]|uniref:Uncharacterized protein n=1 Tax=Pinctada imbricata TaxID=66713 RepID=A0AA88Y305_PINIB|nr:hypothetical protein FSP39_008826 [Pinctada imbricata]
MSTNSVLRSHGEALCEQAIRDNFTMYPTPFILQRDRDNKPVKPPQHISTARSLLTDPPPPYAPPPTYQQFVDLSQDELSANSNDENVYETFESSEDQANLTNNSGNPLLFKEPKLWISNEKASTDILCNRRKESMESAVPESEDDVFTADSLRSRLSRTPQSLNSDSSFISQSDSPRHSDSMQQPFIPVYREGGRRRKPKKRNDKAKKSTTINKEDKHDKVLSEDDKRIHKLNGIRNGSVSSTRGKSPSDFLDSGDSSVEHVYSVSSKHRRGVEKIVTEFTNNGIISMTSPTQECYPITNGVYEGIEDCRLVHNVTPSRSTSSQASLRSSSEALIDYAKAIDELHPGLSDPRVLETMI